jgi:hypothetical protein
MPARAGWEAGDTAYWPARTARYCLLTTVMLRLLTVSDEPATCWVCLASDVLTPY